MVKMKPFTTVS